MKKRTTKTDSDKTQSAFSDPAYKEYAANVAKRARMLGVPPPENRAALDIEQKSSMDGLLAEEKKAQDIINQEMTDFWEKVFLLDINGRKGISSIRRCLRASKSSFDALSNEIKRGDFESVKKTPINSTAIDLAISIYEKVKEQEENVKKLKDIRKKIGKLQERICVSLMPLALGRATRFWRIVPPSDSLTHMDLVSLANLGILNAIRKWRGEYNTSFRVFVQFAIAALLIPAYSRPFMSMTNNDLASLYAVNKQIGEIKKQGRSAVLEDESLESLAEETNKTNESKKNKKELSGREVSELLNAQRYVSANQTTEDSETELWEMWADPESTEDVLDGKIDLMNQLSRLRESMQNNLTSLERKALQLCYSVPMEDL